MKTSFAAEDLVGGEAADGGVQELDHVKGGQGALAAAAEAAHELKQAAGIGGDDSLRVRVEQMTDLAVAKLLRGLGLEEVVDAGGAAAERRLGDLGDFELRNLREQVARLLEDSLRVTEVAGVVIGDAHGQRIARRDRRQARRESR